MANLANDAQFVPANTYKCSETTEDLSSDLPNFLAICFVNSNLPKFSTCSAFNLNFDPCSHMGTTLVSKQNVSPVIAKED